MRKVLIILESQNIVIAHSPGSHIIIPRVLVESGKSALQSHVCLIPSKNPTVWAPGGRNGDVEIAV